MRAGWEYKTIGEIAVVTDFVANGSFASLRENVKYLNEPDYAVLVRLADYSSNFDSSKFVYVNQKSYNFLAKSSLQGGEIIMSNVGSLGKLFICPDLNRPMTLGPNTIVIKTAHNKFFHYLFSSETFQHDLKTISSQTALPKFNKTSFKKLRVSIPPIPQQRLIVSELDEINSLLALKREQLKKYDELAQSLFYEMFGDPVENEKGWEVKKLGEVCTKITDGSHFSPAGHEDGTYPMLSVKDMVGRGFSYTNCKYINEDDYSILLKQGCKPLLNDVLVAKDGSYFKCAFVVTEEREQAILSSIAILRPDLTIIEPVFLQELLLQKTVKDCIDRFYVTGTAIKRVILKKLGTFSIPLPPLSLQQTFAHRIEQIEEQKKHVTASIAKLETLLASRMQYWFE